MVPNHEVLTEEKKQKDLIIDDRGYTYDPSKPRFGLSEEAYKCLLKIREDQKKKS